MGKMAPRGCCGDDSAPAEGADKVNSWSGAQAGNRQVDMGA